MLEIGFFRLARSVSKFSDYKIKIGAVIVKKKPISAAANKLVTHPKYANPNKTDKLSVHAEVRAVINSETSVEGSTIYVYREKKDGTPGLARPCKHCLAVLKDAGVKKIIYTTNEFPFWRSERL